MKCSGLFLHISLSQLYEQCFRKFLAQHSDFIVNNGWLDGGISWYPHYVWTKNWSKSSYEIFQKGTCPTSSSFIFIRLGRKKHRIWVVVLYITAAFHIPPRWSFTRYAVRFTFYSGIHSYAKILFPLHKLRKSSTNIINPDVKLSKYPFWKRSYQYISNSNIKKNGYIYFNILERKIHKFFLIKFSLKL